MSQGSRYQAIGHGFSMSAEDPALDAALRHLLAPLEADGPSAPQYRIVGPTAEQRYILSLDGQTLREHADPAVVVGHLFWSINRLAVDQAFGAVVFHAAAVARRGQAILMPAAMEAGKTTLAAGLVRAGFGYLTDEAAAVDPASLRIRPYHKPLSLDPGSWDLLADLRPQLPEEVRPYFDGQWQVSATDIRPDALAGPTEPRFVVFPRYEGGARTTLTERSRAGAVLAMADQCFSFGEAPVAKLDLMVRLARTCRTYDLVVGDLTAACEALGELADG